MPKGFLPERRHRPALRVHRGGAGHLVRRDGRRSSSRLADIVRRDPNVDSVMAFVGAGGSSSALNIGRILIALKPRSERKLGADAGHPGAAARSCRRPRHQRVSPEHPPPIRIGGKLTKSAVPVHAAGHRYAAAVRVGAEARSEAAQRCRASIDVTSDLQISSPQVDVEIDRDKAAALGVTADQIENALYNAFGARQVSTIYTPTNQYWVILELEPQLPGATRGAVAALRALATAARWCRSTRWRRFERGGRAARRSTTRASCRRSRSRSTWRRASRSARRSTQHRRRRCASCGCRPTISGSVPGHRAGVPGVAARAWACCSSLAIFVIYLVLGILYESFIHPLTILSGLPTAAVRRAADAADLFEHRARPLRLCRHDHADRHRQEERHHDDRLRARAQRQDGKSPAAGDLRGVP